MDPGPETVVLLRDLAREDGFHPIRWTIPLGWIERIPGIRNYSVDPRSWDIQGLPLLGDSEEYDYAVSLWGENGLSVHNYAQVCAAVFLRS